MLGTAGDLATQLREMLSALGTAPTPALLADLVEHEEAAWRQAVQLYDDTLSALRELRQRGFRLALISNCSCQAGAVIRHLDFAALVDTLVLSFEVGLAKRRIRRSTTRPALSSAWRQRTAPWWLTALAVSWRQPVR